MAEQLANLSKTALVKKATSLEGQKRSAKGRADEFLDATLQTVGGGTAWATAALIGLTEGRVRNRDKSPLSLGPVTLGLSAGALLTPLSWFFNPGGQVSFMAAGAFAADGVTRGRGWGNAWRLKSPTKTGGIGAELVGSDTLTLEEQELLSDV